MIFPPLFVGGYECLDFRHVSIAGEHTGKLTTWLEIVDSVGCFGHSLFSVVIRGRFGPEWQVGSNNNA
jgi:hypothetical protein